MRFLRLVTAGCLALLLAACAATGPKFDEVQASLPQLRPSEGRIFFFRQTGMGAAIRPDVRLNGEVVGAPEPGSFFFVDRPAGHYSASARTEAESTVEFELRPNETVHVGMQITMGLMVGRPQLTVQAPASGAAAVTGLAYIGSIPLVPNRTNTGTPGAAVVRGATAPSANPSPAARQGAVTMDDLRGLLPAKP